MKPHIQLIRPGHVALDLVKLVVCAIVLTHGVHRYEGGWEFSALLIACFTAVALDHGPAGTLARSTDQRLPNRP
jgi:hypothetical protein